MVKRRPYKRPPFIFYNFVLVYLRMFDQLISFFSHFPHWLATMLMAATPVGELRLSIPVSVLGYHMPVWEAFILSVIGNMIPVIFILLFAGRFHKWVEKEAGKWGKNWADYLAHVQKKFTGDYEKYGLIGLMIFIGVPLPGTGAYTGAIAAFVFGIPFKHSWPYVLGGVIMSAIITTILTVGVDKIF